MLLGEICEKVDIFTFSWDLKEVSHVEDLH